MADAKLEHEALNAWFARCRRLFWKQHRPLAAIAVVAMLSALACYWVLYAEIYWDLCNIFLVIYLGIAAPLLVLMLFALQTASALPQQDLALAFSRRQLYSAVLKYMFKAAAPPFLILWLLPWVVINIGEYHRIGWDELSILLAGMQGSFLLAALLFQGLLITHYSVTSLKSYAIYLPALLFVATNLAFWFWGIGGPLIYSQETIHAIINTGCSICAVLFVLMLIRIHTLPRGFMGYWRSR